MKSYCKLLLVTAMGASSAFLTGCDDECGYGTQMAGRNMVITGPSGNVTSIGTINTGSIQDQRNYALTTQRVTDLVQQMQICCQNEVRARKHNDQATAKLWIQEGLNAFHAMLELQRLLPPSNQPATVAPAIGSTPKTGETTATATPAATRVATAKASPKRVERWLARSANVLHSIQKKTAAAPTIQ